MREMYVRCQPELRNYLRRLQCPEGDIDDLINEAFCRLLRKGNGASCPSPIGMLKRICKNLLIDEFRRNAIVRFRSIVQEDENRMEPRATPEDTLMWQQELGDLQKRLAVLPEKQSAAFTRRFIHHESPGAIAQQLGLSISTIEKHLRKSYRLLSVR